MAKDKDSLFFKELSDRELLSELGKNNESAFNEIYFRYHKMLYLLAYRYLKNIDMAEDAVQQIFLKLWEARKILMISISFKNYLYTMMKYHVMNEIRDNALAIEKNYELIQRIVLEEKDLIDKIEERDLRCKLYEAIEGLPDKKRMICTLKIKNKLSNKEIAVKMGIAVPTVKTHYTESIKILRDKLRSFMIWVM